MDVLEGMWDSVLVKEKKSYIYSVPFFYVAVYLLITVTYNFPFTIANVICICVCVLY